jgi:hypothetical protein
MRRLSQDPIIHRVRAISHALTGRAQVVDLMVPGPKEVNLVAKASTAPLASGETVIATVNAAWIIIAARNTASSNWATWVSTNNNGGTAPRIVVAHRMIIIVECKAREAMTIAALTTDLRSHLATWASAQSSHGTARIAARKTIIAAHKVMMATDIAARKMS